MIRYAIALAAVLATTSAHAEVVAAALTKSSSSVMYALELHDHEAEPRACKGRTGYPAAVIGGMSPNAPKLIHRLGIGCWWPNGDGTVTLFMRSNETGAPAEFIRNINDFVKTEHFTDWNMSPVSATQPRPKVRPVLRDTFGANGQMEVRLDLDTHMSCHGVPGKAADIRLSKPGQDAFGVKGCWIDNGDTVDVLINNPGAPAILRSYSVSSFDYD
ncbi:hypothetical protein FHR70_000732 [Microvirga lupini]|uniref:Uncharacterized protein n=1 Tax=Microvirga lupini TaxID=420324 RepID=A0A7W4YUR2_9HYPH|nr:hypothetical protein [Microvirga lupini]MBB3017692.1 hypothetical protein [Microvirga lupini]